MPCHNERIFLKEKIKKISNLNMHYFLIAGEPSGDLHASHLIQYLKKIDTKAVITFIGGDKMKAASGEEPVIHCSEMAFMGFSEVIRNFDAVMSNMSKAKRALEMALPDALILIDYPSFNLKIAAKAKKLGIPVFYYISPKIWAWKKWRVHDIRRLVKRMFSILPFEPQFYKENKFSSIYVGNPSVAEVDNDLQHILPRKEFLEKYRLRDRQLIAIMPGSRKGEIRNNLPVMRLAADRFPQYRGVIIGAPGISDEFYEQNGGIRMPVIRDKSAVYVLAHCRAALVTSGTATLETALAGIPQVVCYRANGAKISYDIMKKILSVDYVSLPNLIAGEEIVPEMLVHMCTPDLVADKLGVLLRDTPEREAQIEGYKKIRDILGTGNAPENAARIIVDDLKAV